VAIGVAVNVFAAHRQSQARATATPAPCRPAHPVYGTPPQGLSYAPATAQVRRRTLRALGLDGRADLQIVQRDGVPYGEVVGVPSRDPQGYVDHVVAQAKGKAKRGAGYSLIPFDDNRVVAVGVRGCRAVYVAAATPDDVRVLAPAVLRG
jgi:hypothetical protein